MGAVKTHRVRALIVPGVMILLAWGGVVSAQGRGTTARPAPKVKLKRKDGARAKAVKTPEVLVLSEFGWSVRGSARAVPEVLVLDGPIAPLPGGRRAHSKQPDTLNLGDEGDDEGEGVDSDTIGLRDPRQPLLARGADVLARVPSADGATTLTLLTEPDGAQVIVTLGDQARGAGVTPLVARPIAPELTYTLTISKPGFHTRRRAIKPRRGAHHRLFLQLERR